MLSTKPLHILIPTWEYTPLMAGGLGPLIQAAASELQQQGVQTTTLLPHSIKDTELSDTNIISLSTEVNRYLQTPCILPGYEYNSYNQFQSNKKHTKNSWPDLYANKQSKKNKKTLYPNNMPKQTRAFALAVIDYIRHSDITFDLILAPDWHIIPLFHLIKQDINIPFYFYVNSTEYDRSVKIKSVVAQTTDKMEREFYPQATKVIAISDTSKDILIHHYSVPEEKIITVYDDHDFIPSALDIPLLRSKSQKNVLFVGRLASQKGLGFLLDTAASVIKLDHEITFLIAGQGDALEDIVTMICEYGLEKNVFLTGWVSGEDKRQLYKTCNLFVMPSPSEPFGLTALEAIKSGIPVISSKTCGFLSVIPSTPTFEYYDTPDFAQKIVYYLQHKDAAKELISKQKDDLSRHSWSFEINKLKTEMIATVYADTQ